MALWMTAIYMVAFSTGMHAATIIGHLAVMTMGASLNHAGFDLEIRFLGGAPSSCLFLGAPYIP